ncbi:methyltransferase like 6 [Trypanosoma conorhini]|uniref:tRNA N(3)-methylcytidine methyltransferase n=1 Tax=Trypanosoma conorhini TaxID=83891 RepID=A0A3R7L5P8_9TRYP|nr:methyltransferase like 6 [Trypanosoma conorhini]RNF20261.1 methyltransferase like 6 [Trypanosoma conorhini]
MPDDGMKSSGSMRKRPRDPPFVADYRPYTGCQLAHALKGKTTHKGNWDIYYRNNTVKGYRNRHYIIREFHELREALNRLKEGSSSPAVDLIWMEVGCGVGNAILPILEEYGDVNGWRLVAFDISSVAIELLQKKRNALPECCRGKLAVRVLDPVEEDIPVAGASSGCPLGLAAGSVGFVSMIFVLCSIPVEKHLLVLRRVALCMAEGSVFFFRDYCIDDHAEKRFDPRRQLEENTFTRSNGTLSHFFSLAEVRRLFQGSGFEALELLVVEREVVNRKQGATMRRKFLQGRFRKSGKGEEQKS